MAGPFTTPLGRIVQGDPYKMSPALDTNRQPKLNKQNQPYSTSYFALAIPKNDPEWANFKAQLDAEDQATWPQLWDAATRTWRVKDFADKITDGDSPMLDKSGVAPNSREGWAGCWIMKFSSTYPHIVKVARNGVWADSPGGEVKCGDWARVSFGTDSNNSQQSPGMHRNPEQLAKYRDDTLIVSTGGLTADERFGAPPPAAGGAQPGAGNAASAANPPPPAVTTPPSTTVAAGSPPPPPPPYEKFMDVATPQSRMIDTGVTYDAYIAAGWTEAQLVANGKMRA